MSTVLIIGATGGIGSEVAKLEIQKGSSVIGISRSEGSILNERYRHYVLDINEEELPAIEQIDKLVYCLGSINLKPFEKLKMQDFQSDLLINTLGVVKVLQKYLPQLRNSNEPAILVFSSVAARIGMPFHATIAMAKGALEGLVKSLAAEFAPKIRINAIAPTVTDTNLASRLLRNDKMKEIMRERHPLKRYLNPMEVAETVSFLISNKALGVSGQIIPIDAGITTLKI